MKLPSKEQKTASIDRESLWLITYTSLFTTLLAFFILLMVLEPLENNPQTRTLQQSQKSLETLSIYLKKQQNLDWLAIENTITKGLRFTLEPQNLDDEIFGLGSANLAPTWEIKLQALAHYFATLEEMARARLLTSAKLFVLIEGHTDAQPMNSARFPSNWELSTARAQTVQALLEEVSKFDSVQFGIAGLGSYRPRAKLENFAENRRIEIYIKVQDSAHE